MSPLKSGSSPISAVLGTWRQVRKGIDRRGRTMGGVHEAVTE
ncbi:hypothetical protein [Rhodomicrobium vannielii]|nr:hypothetical protein [Rhodomicrobium vannielii]